MANISHGCFSAKYHLSKDLRGKLKGERPCSRNDSEQYSGNSETNNKETNKPKTLGLACVGLQSYNFIKCISFGIKIYVYVAVHQERYEFKFQSLLLQNIPFYLAFSFKFIKCIYYQHMDINKQKTCISRSKSDTMKEVRIFVFLYMNRGEF